MAADVNSPTWYQLPTEEVVRRLGVDPHAGLSEDEVRRRREQYGTNEIREGRRRGPIAMFLGQFTDFMILVLIAAAVISGLIGDVVDTIVILAIIVLNAVVGFVQEYRADRAIAVLKQMAALSAHVVREGTSQIVPVVELVPGDVVLIEAGNALPADLRLIEAVQLKIEEAALTGESQPVEKLVRVMHESELPLGDRRNMAYKGTLVTYGRGRGVVVATGMETELGRIAALLRAAGEVKTPLQKRLTRFGRLLAIAVLAICAIMFVTGLLRGEPLLLMLLTAISLAVAAIPEALPAVVTVSLALGARKLASQNALIRKLPAVETLGSVTFICSDKTGTLTENRMRVEEVYADTLVTRSLPADAVTREPWRTLVAALALSNDARPTTGNKIIGDPTEVALYQAARQAGADKAILSQTQPRLAEIAFDSERARMTTLHREGDGVIAFTKGAPEHVLPLCHDRLGAKGVEALDRGAVEEVVERMATDGLRVLAVAFRRWPALPEPLEAEIVENRLTFAGLVGLLDPPRAEAREAVQLCRTAGITPVMITGDHPATARAIATRLGIIDEGGEVLSGRELARLDMAQFEEHVERVRVYARVAPEQKIKIVQALQDKGEYVAMTGDGVNDAPALKRADIGIAMGITGTDVAKEAGHMILLDDNFASIVAAVREGRRIFDNIRKFVRFVMTGNSGEIGTLFLAPFLGLPIPLLPIHILWVNLVTDGLPGLALAVEPQEQGIMQRPPRPPRESLFAHGIWQHILWVGGLITALCLVTQAWAISIGDAHWQTMVFTVLTLSQMTHVLAIRSETESLFTRGFTTNLPLLGAVLLTFVLQLATIYVPALNPIFHTQPLTVAELGICLLLSSTVFIAVEIEKWMVRRGWLYAEAR
ncbi:MAG: calcium-translocating P-type ATPase, PMCA-type [Sulfuricaulis sp.]|uniref:calcium-translocating P-type ATPase, PMCA-type n=1 Tax=Sulfuricaulis sp. TaxID=2003553 RepID=UPI0025E5F797|nr:calcium-translocating P-type ATPase, PMCA-type [Sulfuricaulis sp.]MCR4346033.1 calcium-translocating P-type ATPase, PMCA-type [Sulfuricaulis sp.]